MNYWSSSEWGGTQAFNMNFNSNGNLNFNHNNKSNEFRVRPVLACLYNITINKKKKKKRYCLYDEHSAAAVAIPA